jgi:hypothetical protein
MGERESDTKAVTQISNTSGNSSSEPPPEAERRRFIKSSLIGAPVVLTLLSRPVLGGTAKLAGSQVSGSSGAAAFKKP